MHPDHQQRAIPAHTPIPLFQQLRWYITLIFVLVAIIPIVIVELITLPQVMQQAEQKVIDQMESVVVLKQAQIYSWMSDSDTALSLMLSDPFKQEIRNFLSVSPRSLQQQNYINTLLGSAVLYFDTQDSHSHEKQKRLFSQLLIYTPDGKIVAASDSQQIGKLVISSPYFQSSLRYDTISPPFYVLGEENFAIFITKRIFDAQGQLLGVIAARNNQDILNQLMLERTGLGKSGETYLVSKESNYLLTPSRFEGYPLIRSYRSKGITAGLSGNDGYAIYMNYQNPPQLVIGSYRWIPELQAALIAEVRDEEALKSVDLVESISIITALTAAILAGLLGLFFATRIAAPIGHLTDTAMQIADGNFDQRASVSAKNEIGILAASFNSMAAQIKELIEELEQRVAVRTSDLQHALEQREHSVKELQESLSVREQLSDTIRELSSPILPVSDGVIVLPLIGVIDTSRAELLMNEVLRNIERSQARIVIIDITGVPIIDTQIAQALIHTATAARLLGARAMLVGIRPEIAQTLVSLGVNLQSIETYANLRSAVDIALRKQ